MTYSCFQKSGQGGCVGWWVSMSRFGWMAAAATERGLCWLSLEVTRAEAEEAIRAEFPFATLRRDAALAHWVDWAAESVRESTNLVQNQTRTECLDLRGTEFQLRVWRALGKIPRGETRTYSELAREMGNPNATRAVARACAANRVALVVPCHRVVGAGGSLTGYRWGIERKRQILAAEKSPYN